MCWSAEASFAIAAVGVTATGIAIYRKESALLWSPLAFFTAIEVMQGVSYGSIDQCALPANQINAALAYLHVCFQPLFTCLLAIYFVPPHARRRVAAVLLTASALTAAYLLLQFYPFDWAGPCRLGRLLCSEELCVKSGSWHLEWHIPLNDIGERVPSMLLGDSVNLNFPVYFFTMFVLPIIMGSWRVALFQLVTGPAIAWALTSNPNEMPAVWCILSICIAIIVAVPPLRRHMFVQDWPLWPKAV